jgi:hypothetical protein
MDPPFIVYPQRLYFLGKGTALWEPSPQSMNGIRQAHVQIGDLGYISDGRWTYIFNVHKLPQDDGQATRLPRGFDPLRRPDTFSDDLAQAMQWSTSGSKELSLSLEGSEYVMSFQVEHPEH